MLSETGLTPEYINEYWTEELLSLMVLARHKYLSRKPGTVATASGPPLDPKVARYKNEFKQKTQHVVTGRLDLNTHGSSRKRD